MNEKIQLAKKSIIKQKNMYIVLIILTVVGIISGIIFTTILSDQDKLLVQNQINNFFDQIKNNNINYNNGLINCLASNLTYVLLVWLLGISIIGLPIVIFLLFIKGFISGFSIGSIISIYNLKGVFGAFTYSFPHQLINLLFAIFISFYSINFSIKLFKYLFLKKEIIFKDAMKKYSKVLLITTLAFIISSLIEILISPIIMKIFINMI